MENHSINIENRIRTTITDIEEIDSFDEGEVRASLKQGAVVIRGEKLNIEKLDLEEGITIISGIVNSIMYLKTKEKGEQGILAKILK